MPKRQINDNKQRRGKLCSKILIFIDIVINNLYQLLLLINIIIKDTININRYSSQSAGENVSIYYNCTHREILLNQTEIRLYLPCTDRFETKRTSVWFQINRRMVHTI